MMSLSSKTAKIHAAIAVAAIIILFPFLLHATSDMNICLIGLILLFATGILAFLRKSMFVHPKGAQIQDVRRIEYNQRYLPFLATAMLVFLYVRVGSRIAIGLYMLFENMTVSEIVLAIYTAIVAMAAFFLIYMASQPVIIEFPSNDMIRIQKGKEIHESPLKDIKILKSKELIIRGANWELSIKADDSKALEQLYSYLYYKIHPEKLKQ